MNPYQAYMSKQSADFIQKAILKRFRGQILSPMTAEEGARIKAVMTPRIKGFVKYIDIKDPLESSAEFISNRETGAHVGINIRSNPNHAAAVLAHELGHAQEAGPFGKFNRAVAIKYRPPRTQDPIMNTLNHINPVLAAVHLARSTPSLIEEARASINAYKGMREALGPGRAWRESGTNATAFGNYLYKSTRPLATSSAILGGAYLADRSIASHQETSPEVTKLGSAARMAKQSGFFSQVLHMADDVIPMATRMNNGNQDRQQQEEENEQPHVPGMPKMAGKDTDLISPVTIQGALGGGFIGALAGRRAGNAGRELSGRVVAHAIEPHIGTEAGRMVPKGVRMLNHMHSGLAVKAPGRLGLAGALIGTVLGAAPGLVMGAALKARDLGY